jgi:hypothetical protein
MELFPMTDHHKLFTVLQTLGYGADEIRAAQSAIEGVEIENVRAARDRVGMTELTPMAAAAQSPRHAAMLKQTLGLIKTASRYRYELPLDRPVDLNEVSLHIQGGSIENRMAIKSNLAQLGLCR